jgi:potassium uptake TrkH family protein
VAGRLGSGASTSQKILDGILNAVPSAFRLRHPAQVVVFGFAVVIALGAVLLSLPVATAGPQRATLLEALFTSTSAVCVTGLIVVDTPVYWSPFGHGVILGLIQLGGFGIMTAASVLGLVVSRRLGLRSRLTAATESGTVGIGDVRNLLRGIARTTLVVEAVVAVFIILRLWIAYDASVGEGIWLGVFHSVSAFNNAGFSLYSDNLMGFVTDAWIMVPLAAAVILGGLGFPVILEIWRNNKGRRGWSLHTKITLGMTALLVASGTIFVTAMEWGNPSTLGPLDVPGKLLAGFFQAIMPRTAGFNSVDIAAMSPATWLGMDVMMFIGGGSAGTAGGIKVTTFAVLLFVIVAEARGDDYVFAFRRRIPRGLQRQALTVALTAVAAVVMSTLFLLIVTNFSLDQVLFEVVSAFATVGLSTGITADLPGAGQLVLTMLMFLGRLGPVTLATALALRHRQRMFTYPEEQPIIG